MSILVSQDQTILTTGRKPTFQIRQKNQKERIAHPEHPSSRTHKRSQTLQDWKQSLANQDKVNAICKEGQAGRTIVEIAKAERADRIVMGTHGYTGWTRLAMGSVAEYVVRHAHCHVLTTKWDTEADTQEEN